jgi:hypothetical protein
VDHVLSVPPPGREEWFMLAPCCWYAAGGGAVGGGAPVVNLLLYASGGAEGYIAWDLGGTMREGRRARQVLVLALMILSADEGDEPGQQRGPGNDSRSSLLLQQGPRPAKDTYTVAVALLMLNNAILHHGAARG